MTMYLDDTLTQEELSEASRESRLCEAHKRTHNPASNPHGIPFAGEADPRLVIAGDMVAIYAGNDHPSHVVTVEATPEHDDIQRVVNFETTGGQFTVAYGMRVWVAAYAPLLGE